MGVWLVTFSPRMGSDLFKLHKCVFYVWMIFNMWHLVAILANLGVSKIEKNETSKDSSVVGSPILISVLLWLCLEISREKNYWKIWNSVPRARHPLWGVRQLCCSFLSVGTLPLPRVTPPTGIWALGTQGESARRLFQFWSTFLSSFHFICCVILENQKEGTLGKGLVPFGERF